jgi:hypothetical protein
MSETLFDYEDRRFREEVLYLLRQLAEYQGIIPFDEKDRRRHVDPDWDGCVSEDPHAALEAVLRDSDEKLEDSTAPAEEKTAKGRYKRPRLDWSKLDSRVAELGQLQTLARKRAQAYKDPKSIATAKADAAKFLAQADRRRNAIYREIDQGRAELVDGVLYDLRSGVRAPWDASLFVTK